MTRQQHSSRALVLLSCFALLFVWAAPLWAEWKEKVLYSFQGGADGAAPVGGVVFGPDGTLYGATQFGGADNCSPMAACGTVYKLAPQKNGSWAETVLYVFKGKAFNDGEYPEGGLIADSSGNLYGTTAYGGSGNCVLAGSAAGCGTVFELSPPQQKGQAWTETILYSFPTAKQGYVPAGDLVFDKSGNLYGSTIFGGGKGTTCDPFYQYCGAVFKLIAPRTKNGKWTEKVLHSFASGKDGANPNGGLLLDAAGVIYGTTFGGGDENGECGAGGCGTAFELKPPTKKKGVWAENVLLRFNIQDGAEPEAGFAFGRNGDLYGTTYGGGTDGSGAVFQLAAPTGGRGPWKETILYRFGGRSDGSNPGGAVIFDAAGGLYGTALGGSTDAGVVFSLKPPKHGNSWPLTVLYNFTGPPDGAHPAASLVFDKAGNLYSTTQSGGTGTCSFYGYGTVFEVAP